MSGTYSMRIAAPYDHTCVPGETLPAGAAQLLVLARDGKTPLTGETVRFHMVSGSGSFTQGQTPEFAEGYTGGNGIVWTPELEIGDRAGRRILVAQTLHARSELVFDADYDGVKLEPGPRTALVNSVDAGDVKTLHLRARSPRGNTVARLPLVVEVVRGWALLNGPGGRPTTADVFETGTDGTVRLDVEVGRRDERVELAVSPLWTEGGSPLTLVLDVRSPSLVVPSHVGPSVDSVPEGSVARPVRVEIRDQRARLLTNRSSLALLAVGTGGPTHEPEAQGARYQERTVILKGEGPGARTLTLSLPDFPDTPAVDIQERFDVSVNGRPVTTTSPGPGPLGSRAYVESSGGGNVDPDRQLQARVVAGALAYVGPDTVTATPFQVQVSVLPPRTANRRLVRARVRFKVRTAPGTSFLDDPDASNLQNEAGGVSTTPGGPWTDEVEIPVSGGVGRAHSLAVWFRQNARDLDHHVEVTADADMEEILSDGSIRGVTEETTLLLRAAFLRPRVSLSSASAVGFDPLDGRGVWPIWADRNTPPPLDHAVFVETCLQTPAPSVTGRLHSGSRSAAIRLRATAQEPEGTVFRSGPCFVISNPRAVGRARPGDTYLLGDGSGTLHAVVDLPGGAASPPFASAPRPLGRHALEWGGAASTGRLDPSRPYLTLRLPSDGTVRATTPSGTTSEAVAGRTAKVRIALEGVVRDPASEVADLPDPSLEIAGQSATLIRYDGGRSRRGSASTGPVLRPKQRTWRFDQRIEVGWGMQHVDLVVTNALGGVDRVSLDLEVVRAPDGIGRPRVRAFVRATQTDPRPRPPAFAAVHCLFQDPRLGAAAQGASVQLATGSYAWTGVAKQITQRALLARTEPLICVWEDRLPAPVRAQLPPGLLPLRSGVALEWTVQPRAGGPTGKGSTVPRGRTVVVQVERSPGVWKRRRRGDGPLEPGDAVRLIVRSAPGRGTLDTPIRLEDFGGNQAPGDDRWHYAQFRESSKGVYRLDSVQAFPSGTFTSVAAIRLIGEGEAAPAVGGEAVLRVERPGHIVFAELDTSVPVVPLPRRVEALALPAPQEGFHGGARRIGWSDSVVAATGECVLSAVDLEVKSRGASLSLARTHRSLQGWTGALGPGWHASWESWLWREGPNVLAWLTPTGQIARFTKKRSTWVPPDGLFVRVRETGRTVVIEGRGGDRTTFSPVCQDPDAALAMVSTEDRFGNRIRLIRERTGVVVGLQEPLGRGVQMSFDPVRRRLVAVGDHSGRRVAYRYYRRNRASSGERTGHLSEVTDNAHSVSYGYMAGGHTLGGEDAAPLAWLHEAGVGVRRTGGKLLTLEYDPVTGQVTSQEPANRDALTFRYSATETEWRLPGATWGKAVFPLGLADYAPGPTRLESPSPTGATIVDRFAYAKGNLVRHEMSDGRVWKGEFDVADPDPRNWGSLTKSTLRAVADVAVLRTDGSSHRSPLTGKPESDTIRTLTTETKWDRTLQLPVERRDSMGAATFWTYDSNGRLAAIQEPSIGSLRSVPTSHDPEPCYLYNHWGQKIAECDPNGVVTVHEYHPAPNWPLSNLVSSTTTPGGYLASVTTDAPVTAQAQGWPARAAHLVKRREPVTVLFEVDALGRTTRSSAKPSGDDIRLEYDRAGRLETRTAVNTGHVTRWYYAERPGGPTVEQVDEIKDATPPAPLTGSTTPVLRTIRTAYDRHGNLIRSVDDLGHISRWVFDRAGRLSESHTPESGRGKGLGTTLLTYHPGGEIDIRTRGVDPTGNVDGVQTRARYDQHGRSLGSDTARGPQASRRWVRDERLEYDGFGRVSAVVNARGARVERTFDPAGRLIRERVVVPRSGRSPAVASEVLNYVDESGRLQAIERPIFCGVQVRPSYASRVLRLFAYDAAGHRVWERTQDGGEVETTLMDGHGFHRTVETRDVFGSAKKEITSRQKSTARIAVVRTESGGEAVEVHSVFDAAGRVVGEEYHNLVSGEKRLLRRRHLDSLGRLRFLEAVDGPIREFRYDAAGRLAEETIHTLGRSRATNLLDPSLVGRPAPPALARIFKQYNRVGQVVRVVDERPQRGRTVRKTLERYEYDFRGLPSKRSFPTATSSAPGAPASPRLESYRYAYEADGRLSAVTDPEGSVLSYVWDDPSGMYERTVKLGGSKRFRPQETKSERFENDLLGRVTRAATSTHQGWSTAVTREYDSLDRVVSETSAIDANGHSTSWKGSRTVDLEQGNTRLTLPERVQVEYSYDMAGRPNAVRRGRRDRFRYVYQDRRLQRVRMGSGIWSSMEYDDWAQPEEVTLASSLTKRWKYDGTGLPKLTSEQWLGSQEQSTAYEFDVLGRLDRTVSFGQNVKWQMPMTEPSALANNGYDAYGNPTISTTEMVDGWIDDSAGFGALEPRHSAASTTGAGRLYGTTRRFNANTCQIMSQVENIYQGPVPVTYDHKYIRKYAHDVRGNVVEAHVSRYLSNGQQTLDYTRRYRYDFWNRLIEVRSGRTGTRYDDGIMYDAFGRYVARTEARSRGKRWRFLHWFSSNLVGERDAAGQVDRVYVPDGLGKLGNVKIGNQWYYRAADSGGQTRALLRPSGAVAEIYGSTPSGSVTYMDAKRRRRAPLGNAIVREGHYWLRQSRLHLVGPRAFDPITGTFLQRDPGGSLADPLTHGNPYTYAGNNPVAFSDDGGAVPLIIGGVVIAAGLIADYYAIEAANAGMNEEAQKIASFGLYHMAYEAGSGETTYTSRELGWDARITRALGFATAWTGAWAGARATFGAARGVTMLDLGVAATDSAYHFGMGVYKGDPLRAVLGAVGLGLTGVAARGARAAPSGGVGGRSGVLASPPVGSGGPAGPVGSSAGDFNRLVEASLPPTSPLYQAAVHDIRAYLDDLIAKGGWSGRQAGEALIEFNWAIRAQGRRARHVSLTLTDAVDDIWTRRRAGGLYFEAEDRLFVDLRGLWRAQGDDLTHFMEDFAGILCHEVRHYWDNLLGSPLPKLIWEFRAHELQAAISPRAAARIESSGGIIQYLKSSPTYRWDDLFTWSYRL